MTGHSTLGNSVNPLKPLMEEILALSDKKQLDYGSDSDPFANVRRSEELGIPAWKGACVRLGDKWQRIQQYARTESLANESFEDSLMDAAVYSLIALLLFREARAETGPFPSTGDNPELQPDNRYTVRKQEALSRTSIFGPRPSTSLGGTEGQTK
jgi:hypothetical protein